jgi:hypothetical protein
LTSTSPVRRVTKWLCPFVFGLLACASAQAREFGRVEAYCQADAIFVGIATKVYFNSRPDMDSCQGRPPDTVAQFADQGMICYPLIVEVDVKEFLFNTEPRQRSSYRLHMKFASPDSLSDSIKDLASKLQGSPHIYSVALLPAYEKDGYTWLLGYPRNITEREYLRGMNGKPQCKPPR